MGKAYTKKNKCHDLKDRKNTFYSPKDPYLNRFELIRYLHYNPNEKITSACKNLTYYQ